MQTARGAGRTTEQMKTAPEGAIFVYTGDRRYSELLARHLGRSDLVLCPMDYLAVMRQVTGTQRQVVIDHAQPADNHWRTWREFEAICSVRERQRARA